MSRSRRSVNLTDSGLTYYQRACAILDQLAPADNAAAASDGAVCDYLCGTAPRSPSSPWISRRFSTHTFTLALIMAQECLRLSWRFNILHLACIYPKTRSAISLYGYRLKDMTEQVDDKAAEIRAMFTNQFESKRTAEIRGRMLAAALPI